MNDKKNLSQIVVQICLPEHTSDNKYIKNITVLYYWNIQFQALLTKVLGTAHLYIREGLFLKMCLYLETL
jgi:hypothetical protein